MMSLGMWVCDVVGGHAWRWSCSILHWNQGNKVTTWYFNYLKGCCGWIITLNLVTSTSGFSITWCYMFYDIWPQIRKMILYVIFICPHSSLPKIIVNGYKTLNLQYFFTTGPDEVRAWTIQVWISEDNLSIWTK